MGIKILQQRHRTAPPMNGCRWCGFLAIDHANRWVPGKRWHTYVDPTAEQRKARHKAGSGYNHNALSRTPTVITNLASDARTRL